MNEASPFKLARRAAAMNPSVIREILKLAEKDGVISFAGGLPSPRTFPVEAMREAWEQAADLHTPSFNQRIVYEVIRTGFLDRHAPTIRALYKAQRDAMLAALERHMPEGVSWNRPAGGMFLWVELPASMNATGLLPLAVERGVAFVPGTSFFAGGSRTNTLRLSFVTASEAQIETGIASLGEAIRMAKQQAQQETA